MNKYVCKFLNEYGEDEYLCDRLKFTEVNSNDNPSFTSKDIHRATIFYTVTDLHLTAHKFNLFEFTRYGIPNKYYTVIEIFI